MIQLFSTDFIKNRTIQLFTLIGMFIDIISSETIIHAFVLFCLPYAASIALNYIMNLSNSKKECARVSNQYKPKPPYKIKIMPR